jgi:hypothetical protein
MDDAGLFDELKSSGILLWFDHGKEECGSVIFLRNRRREFLQNCKRSTAPPGEMTSGCNCPTNHPNRASSSSSCTARACGGGVWAGGRRRRRGDPVCRTSRRLDIAAEFGWYDHARLMSNLSLKLPESLLQRLEQESRARRLSKSALVRSALERELQPSKSARAVTCYDLAHDLAGSIRKKLPKDLATNPKHMKGIGR